MSAHRNRLRIATDLAHGQVGRTRGPGAASKECLATLSWPQCSQPQPEFFLRFWSGPKQFLWPQKMCVWPQKHKTLGIFWMQFGASSGPKNYIRQYNFRLAPKPRILAPKTRFLRELPRWVWEPVLVPKTVFCTRILGSPQNHIFWP